MKSHQSAKFIPKDLPKLIKNNRLKSSKNFPIIPFDKPILSDKFKKIKNAQKKSQIILDKNILNNIYTSSKQKPGHRLNSVDSKQTNKKISTNSKNYIKAENLVKLIDVQKQVFKNLRNKYNNPYMEYLIKKGYYKQSKLEDYPKYFNNYLTGYILENKKCRFNAKYKECMFMNNNQEYFIKYFQKNESKLVISFLVRFIYDKDKNTVGFKQTTLNLEIKNKTVNLLDNDIKDLFWKIVKNNYSLNDDISETTKTNNRNTKQKPAGNILCRNLTLLKPLMKKKINYFYVKDIPYELLCNSVPNLYPIEDHIKIYLKDYLKLCKFKKIVKLENAQKKIIIKKSLEIEKKEESVKNKLNKEKENIETFKSKDKFSSNETKSKDLIIDLSSSSEYDDKKSDNIDFSKMKNNYNSNNRLEKDLDIYDIENLINKILSVKPNKKIIKKKLTKSSRENDLKQTIKLDKNKKDGIFLSLVNCKKNSKYDKKIRSTDSNINNNLKKINQQTKIINEKNKSEFSVENKIALIRNLNKERRIQYHNYLLSSNRKKALKSKCLIKIKKKLVQNNNDFLLDGSKTNTNILIRKNSSNLPFKDPIDFYTKIERKKFKINKSKLSLKEFNKRYEKYKDLSPYFSNKKLFTGTKNVAFSSSCSGISLFPKKTVSEWEDKKEDEHQLKNILYSKKIMDKAKYYIAKKKNVFKDCKNLTNLNKFIFRADIY